MDTPQYDLLLKNGHVIDPKNNIDGKMDVAICGKTIAAVAAVRAAPDQRLVLSLLTVFGPISMDLYLPVLPALTADLGLPA